MDKLATLLACLPPSDYKNIFTAEVEQLRTTVAEQQAQIKVLREALEHCLADGDFDTDDARVSFKQGLIVLAKTKEQSCTD